MMKLAMKKRQKGVTMIEYGLIAALISIAAILVLPSIGTSITDTFQKISDSLAGGTTTTPTAP